MTKNEIKDLIRRKADEYNTKEFIESDPIFFPRKLHYFGEGIKDVEISAIIASWMAYGKRSEFMRILDVIHGLIMRYRPYRFIENQQYEIFKDDDRPMYRFYKYSDFYALCFNLYTYYFQIHKGKTIGDVLKEKEDPLIGLIHLFDNIKGFPKNNKSACKKLCMLLRWMVRDDNIVDMGLWNLDKSKLIIPLDTHVHQTALKLGITDRKQADMKTALEVTDFMKEIFPDDPAKGDFALYGLGLDQSIDLLSK